MEAHVIEGYEKLKYKFEFTADIVAKPHSYQKNSYPKGLPKYTQEYSEGTKILIDFYQNW